MVIEIALSPAARTLSVPATPRWSTIPAVIVAAPDPVGTSDNLNFNVGVLPVVPADSASNRYVRFV
jgi:hypothetical protein